jgi:glycosyltransferase involved in cell wall biosynthesis
VATLLGDGEGVSIVPRRDPSALAGAIERLLLNPERRAAQSAAAAERLPRYHIDNVAREFADLYERLIAESTADLSRATQRARLTTQA